VPSVRRVSAFTDDALGKDDALGVRQRILDGEITAKEAASAAYARIAKVNPKLNAMAAVSTDPLGDHGDGFWEGVPTLLKDNIDARGMATMHGTDAFEPRPVARDGETAKAFRMSGFSVLGKTQLSEWGFSPAADHPRLGSVRTPWDATRYAGASSAGAGALVAAGAIPIAHGNDGGGSIRIPASVNGLVGLKPTRGRVPQDPYYSAMPVKLVVDGVLTRSVRDTAAFIREIDRRHHNASLPPVGDVTRPGRRRLRIAWTTEGAGFGADAQTRELTEKTAARLAELGHLVEEVELPIPETLADDFLLYWGSLAGALVGIGRLRRGWDETKLTGLTVGLAKHARKNALAIPGAVTRLRRIGGLSEQFHELYDVVLTPTLAHETPKVGYLDPQQPYEDLVQRLLEWVVFTPWANITGAPSISLPVAQTKRGLPQGMMFTARNGWEATLLELAYELEEAIGFAPMPGL
jgi:amidase